MSHADETQPDPYDTLPPSQDPAEDGGVLEAPSRPLGILRRLGPGLIIAGSIVGSGELIATTKTGAEAGITLLWLVFIGCLIKVFVQVELGRFSISHGETTLAALNRVPGPRARGVNWIVWFWLAMMLVGTGQLGGIVGGVGQALALTWPISGDYVEVIRVPAVEEIERYVAWDEGEVDQKEELAAMTPDERTRVRRGIERIGEEIEAAGPAGEEALRKVRAGKSLDEPYTTDDKIWAAFCTLLTIGLLYNGRYRVVQSVSVVLVVSFTFITIGNVIALQMTDEFHISSAQILRGLSFGLPRGMAGTMPVATALATFGIIGVGASELISYPYWCLEKGYAKFTGPRSEDPAWTRRARGWMRVMHWDAILSMVVYTISTLAFFLMGVAVLYRDGRNPSGMRMISTLRESYVPVFGDHAGWMFLVGAVAVLYSTFLVAGASHSRTFTDAFKVFGWMRRDDQRIHNRSVGMLGVLLPIIWLATYVAGANPVFAVLLSGAMGATFLPMIAFGALYFRYKLTDKRLRPSPVWDFMLIVSSAGMLITGVWGLWKNFEKVAAALTGTM